MEIGSLLGQFSFGANNAIGVLRVPQTLYSFE